MLQMCETSLIPRGIQHYRMSQTDDVEDMDTFSEVQHSGVSQPQAHLLHSQSHVIMTQNGKATADSQRSNLRKSLSLQNMAYTRSRKRLESGESISTDEESFLIGRSMSRPVLQVCSSSDSENRQLGVRIIEVAPSNSNLISNEKEWQMPLHIYSSMKRGKREEDKKLSQRIRAYYKAQDDLIGIYENLQQTEDENEAAENANSSLRNQKMVLRLSKISFYANLALMVGKSVAVGLSASIAIISSLVDSVVDLVSGIIIWWSTSMMKKRNLYDYPTGRSRLEPIAIVILSVIMSLASFQLMIESVQKIVGFSVGSDTSPPIIELPTILLIIGTVLTKVVLFVICRYWGGNSSSVRALVEDHRNDILSNAVAIVCGYLGSEDFIKKTGEWNVVYIDAIGAILISLYILVNWWKTGYAQIKLLTGYTAKPGFLSKITWVCLNHHHDILQIDTVRAFHFGNNFLVEADIVLPEDMTLMEAHNIGESLQQKLERFPEVERAFVHLDYETTHNPEVEHKLI
ncbi:hypothetical protein ScPMuIL_009409 [Solemya velum]